MMVKSAMFNFPHAMLHTVSPSPSEGIGISFLLIDSLNLSSTIYVNEREFQQSIDL